MNMRAILTYNATILPNIVVFLPEDRIVSEKQEIEEGMHLLLLIRRDGEELKNPVTTEDIFPIGVPGVVQQKDESGGLLIETGARADVSALEMGDGRLYAEFTFREEKDDLDPVEEARRLGAIKSEILKLSGKMGAEEMTRAFLDRWVSMPHVMIGLSTMLPFPNERRYEILAEDSLTERNRKIEVMLYEFIQMSDLFTDGQIEAKQDNMRQYRENAIRQQIRYLESQLDEMHPDDASDVRRFEKKIRTSGMNETARKEAEKILNRMKQEGKNGHEYGMLYDYLDFVTGLSWKKPRAQKIDLLEAEKVLDEDHFGLRKVKDRIIQQIAVMNLRKAQAGSILLFVGAPGTGKTSIGQSIAKALKRKYARVSLGGIRDEADIRGHRRTYIGAMPGRIMDGIYKSGASNPVMVLDEVDKLEKSFNGDPASALLEVLDPEQNNSFTDHYMNVPYDLSDVTFICTANTTETIPEPLLNRMEVIRFPGYTITDKLEIAKRHLLPRSMKAMGIGPKHLTLEDGVLDRIISDFTMESGVRGLRKCLDTLCRIAAVQIVRGGGENVTVTSDNLRSFLDEKPIRHSHIKPLETAGIVTGLAWTPVGGDVLFIETAFTKGEGKRLITGQLGDVMQESAEIAVTLTKQLYPDKAQLFKDNDLHIHVPDGAVKKDGPSAGITLTTALASLVTGIVVPPEYGMTGEVSLRGDVMPIGGLPEKLMAAMRAGVKTVFIPEDNADDLEDVQEEVRKALEIIKVRRVTDVLGRLGLLSR